MPVSKNRNQSVIVSIELDVVGLGVCCWIKFSVSLIVLFLGETIVGTRNQVRKTARIKPIIANKAICLCDGTSERRSTTKTPSVVEKAISIGRFMLFMTTDAAPFPFKSARKRCTAKSTEIPRRTIPKPKAIALISFCIKERIAIDVGAARNGIAITSRTLISRIVASKIMRRPIAASGKRIFKSF